MRKSGKTNMKKHPRDWRSPFSFWPAWMCSTCQKSSIVLVSSTLKHEETGPSKRSRNNDDWEPSWTETRFSTLFCCTNEVCKEIVCCVGDRHVEDDYQGGYRSLFKPLHFHPPLNFFRIDDLCPEEVQHQLKRAFASAWSDSATSANALRSTLEAILTDRRIARTTTGKNGSTKGKRISLSLQSRIDKYVQKEPDVANLMKALRWLGNHGSHAYGTDPTMAILLDAFQIVEHVISHIYVKRQTSVEKMATRIVKAKGKSDSRK